MNLHEELNNSTEHQPFLYSGMKKFVEKNHNTGKIDEFTLRLKKLLNPFDSEDVMVRKVVETSLSIEFEGKLDKKELHKMMNVISDVFLMNAGMLKELVFVARSVLDGNDSQNIVIH